MGHRRKFHRARHLQSLSGMRVSDLSSLSDDRLLAGLKRLVGQERERTAAVIAYLAEVDQRRVYRDEGYASLFEFCVRALHFSENEAYRRITAARTAVQFPSLLDRLAEGSLTLTVVCLLASHMNGENQHNLQTAAAYKTRREVEELLARIFPAPAAPTRVRKLPTRKGTRHAASHPGESNSPPPAGLPGLLIAGEGAELPPLAPASPETHVLSQQASPSRSDCAVIQPLAPERYRITVTVDGDTHRTFRQVQELMRHQVPNGDPALVLGRALTLLLEKLLKEKGGVAPSPRKSPGAGNNGKRKPVSAAAAHGTAESRRPPASGSRHIPAEVRRAVWRRDGGQCAYIGRGGHRCSARGKLEFHHVYPYALGGNATVENIALRCRSHNQHEGRQIFGARPP